MKQLLMSLVVSLFFSVNPLFAKAKQPRSCAKAKVLSFSDTCESIKVGFDLRKCGDHSPMHPTTHHEAHMTCDGEKATASLEFDSVIYTARLKKAEGWGGSSWEIHGSVKQHVLQKHQEVQKVAESAVNSNRAPASVPVTTPPTANPITIAGLTITGLFDFYYSYNFNHPYPVTLPSSTTIANAGPAFGNNNYRYYDQYHNQITLSLVELELKKTSPEMSFIVDFDFGTFADMNAATANGTDVQIIDEVSKHLGQAFFTYTPVWAPRLSFDVGKMPAHIGLENMRARDNSQYSRSFLFSWGSPFWHTGVHANYAVVPERLQAGFYIYNGWNSIYSSNAAKTFGTQLKFTPADLVIIYNMIAGPEQPQDSKNWRVVNEVNVTWNISSMITLALDALYGSESSVLVGDSTDRIHANWWGIYLAPKFQLHPHYYFSPRFEVYRDPNGYTLMAGQQTIQSYTFTNSLTPADGFELRLELKYDHSTSNEFFTTKFGTSSSQFTSLLALMYSF